MTLIEASEAARPRVEAPYLIIQNLTALPQRCIVTNQPVPESEYRVWSLPYIPGWLVFLMFMGTFFVITAPFVRQRCKIKAGLSARIRRKRRLIKLFAMLIIFSPFVAAFAAIFTQREGWLVIAAFAMLVSYFTLPLLVLRWQPMQGRRSRDGFFWIQGCSPQFLASLG